MQGGEWLLALVCVIGAAAWWWRRRREARQKQRERVERGERRQKKIPKGSKGWPLIGETLDFIASGYSSRPVSFMDKRRELYGRVFQTHLLGKAIVVSTDSEVNRAVLTSDGFVPSYPQSVVELLGKDSILQAEGALHRRVHGLIGGFLKSATAKAAVTSELEYSVLNSLSKWPEKGLVYLQDETEEITFPVLVKILMGMGPGEDLDYLKQQFHLFVKGLICLPIKLPGTRLYRSLKAKEGVQRTINKIVLAKVQAGKYDMASDVVDVLISESITNKLTEMPISSISSIITELMLPGEHSVPMMMTLVVKYLTDKPLALKKLREENLALRQKKVEMGEPYTWADYMSLTFTHQAINESLRMANIVNGVWRKATKDIEIKGYLIPKDWCMLASFSSVHFDEETYPDPYDFNPWRWERVICGSKFTPFGGGQRLCPGQDISRLEICIFLHHLVTKYSWVAEDDEIVSFPIVKMKRKMPIRVSQME